MVSVSKYTRLEKQLLDISKVAYEDENRLVEAHIARLGEVEAKRKASQKLASKLIRHIQLDRSVTGMENFMNQFGLNNYEGITIMCMAEALLRIPDNHTADRLIHDKLKDAQWDKYLGNTDSMFVNASLWGLALTGSVVNLAKEGTTLVHMRNKIIGRLGDPVIRNALKKAMKSLGAHFVVGKDIAAARAKGRELEKKGYSLSYDMLGEGARTWEQAEKYFSSYLDAIESMAEGAIEQELLDRPGISIKLSALHPRYEWLNRDKVRSELLPKVKQLALAARKHNVAISIDAEESARLDLELGLFLALISDDAFAGYGGIGFVLQAYQKRAYVVLEWLRDVARAYEVRIPVRLVKGAYWDTEIHYAQLHGLSEYPVYTQKHHTDIAYLSCATMLLNEGCFYPQFATHNATTVSTIITIAAKGQDFEFQRLYGMGQEVYDALVKEYKVRVYAPVGKYNELLPYLIRRLIENGANNSFVHQVYNSDLSISDLVECPIVRYKERSLENKIIAQPEDILRGRPNSKGVDLGNAHATLTLLKKRGDFVHQRWNAGAIVSGVVDAAALEACYAPASLGQVIGQVSRCHRSDVEQALNKAEAAFEGWNKRAIAERVEIVRAIGQLFEKSFDELLTMLQLEAGKNLQDAIDEIREAIDFCYYYAMKAEELWKNPEKLDDIAGEINRFSYGGKGVIACISPWNFPLAIFAGQIVAALVTGNTVVAKPAKQTPMIGFKAVQLMYEAGVPVDVLHLLVGDAVKIGDMVCRSPAVKSVVFTGSCATATLVNRQLAKRDGAIANLIAETGGLNAMLVDSTALLEQTVDAIVQSAFGSAGQRCSALRVLFVQEDIADKLIGLIKGAMDCLTMGNPLDEQVDIGPVIDGDAQKKIQNYIRRMKRRKQVIHQHSKKVAGGEKGYYVHPTLIALSHMEELYEEIFGPVLHVIRFDGQQVDQVIETVNNSGYGLTFGIQSRIEQRYHRLSHAINAGNVYVNRSMTGAVVGMQPFGGRGLSGTGHKAGGPHYLLQFVEEKTVSINLAAIGGDVRLFT